MKLGKDRLLKEEVDEALIAQIVSKWTGIPVEKMLARLCTFLKHDFCKLLTFYDLPLFRMA